MMISKINVISSLGTFPWTVSSEICKLIARQKRTVGIQEIFFLANETGHKELLKQQKYMQLYLSFGIERILLKFKSDWPNADCSSDLGK